MDRNIYHNVNEDLSIAPTNESARGGAGPSAGQSRRFERFGLVTSGLEVKVRLANGISLHLNSIGPSVFLYLHLSWPI